MRPQEVVLDAGALIALDRGEQLLRGYVLLAAQGQVVLTTSAAVVAQVWRGGSRQSRLARLLNSDLVDEQPLATIASRRIGVLAAATGTTDVVDGHVAAIALERNAVILTSDPDDLARWGIAEDRIIRC